VTGVMRERPWRRRGPVPVRPSCPCMAGAPPRSSRFPCPGSGTTGGDQERPATLSLSSTIKKPAHFVAQPQVGPTARCHLREDKRRAFGAGCTENDHQLGSSEPDLASGGRRPCQEGSPMPAGKAACSGFGSTRSGRTALRGRQVAFWIPRAVCGWKRSLCGFGPGYRPPGASPSQDEGAPRLRRQSRCLGSPVDQSPAHRLRTESTERRGTAMN
jgi:hypothetical protein